MELSQNSIDFIREGIDKDTSYSQEQRDYLHEEIVKILKSDDLDAYQILLKINNFISETKLKYLRVRAEQSVDKVISDPIHAISSETSQNQLYNAKLRSDLIDKIVEIIQFLNIDEASEYDKLNYINEYLKTTVTIRGEYFSAFEAMASEFDEKELQYRTAYSALLKGQSMCAGYAESCRILCETAGFKTHTLLSRLPGKNKHLMHYVTLVTTSDGISIILDPERESSCERKKQDFLKYQDLMTYFTPTYNFYKSKITNQGVGPDVDLFLESYLKNEKKVVKVKDKNEDLSKKYNILFNIESFQDIDPDILYFINSYLEKKRIKSETEEETLKREGTALFTIESVEEYNETTGQNELVEYVYLLNPIEKPQPTDEEYKKPPYLDPTQHKKLKCKKLDDLLTSEKFSKYIGNRKAVFMVKGTQNISSLEKIMTLIEEQQAKQQTKQLTEEQKEQNS